MTSRWAPCDNSRHKQHELKVGADENHQYLRSLANADVQHDQRNERCRGHVSNEVGAGLEDCVSDMKCAHQDADRYGNDCSERKSAKDAVDTPANIRPELPLLDSTMACLLRQPDLAGKGDRPRSNGEQATRNVGTMNVAAAIHQYAVGGWADRIRPIWESREAYPKVPFDDLTRRKPVRPHPRRPGRAWLLLRYGVDKLWSNQRWHVGLLTSISLLF